MEKIQKRFDDELHLKEQAIKEDRAPVLGSTRLVLFLMFLFCTTNFIYQRFNMNFVLVCMHRPIAVVQPDNIEDPPDFGNLTMTNILADITSGGSILESSSLILDDSHHIHGGGGENDTSWVISEHIDDVYKTSTFSHRKCGSGNLKRNRSKSAATSETIMANKDQHEGFVYDFSWSKETQGGVIAAYYYGLTFSQIPCGWFVDRFGAKLGIILSQLIISILSLLSPMSAYLGPEYLSAVRLLSGVANGAAMPAIFVLATRWCGDMERGSLLGIMSAGFGLAAAIVYPITAFFCENLGWESSFYFGGGTGILWVVFAYFLIFEWPEKHPRIKMGELQFIQKYRAVQYGGPNRERISPPWGSMLTSVPVWAFILANFCVFWCFLTISAFLPTYLEEVLYLDISENGLLSALPYVGMLSLHFIAAFSFDWLRGKNISVTVLRKSYNSLGMFSSGLCIILLGVISCENVAAAVFLLTCSQAFLELPLQGGFLYSIFEIAPKYASSLCSLCNTFGLLTGFITPAVVSYITIDGTLEQWLIVFYLSGAFMIFGGVVYLLFGKCTLLPWAGGTGTVGGNNGAVINGGGGGGSGSSPPSRNNSNKRVEQEMKLLKIRLINGESDVKGQTVKS